MISASFWEWFGVITCGVIGGLSAVIILIACFMTIFDKG